MLAEERIKVFGSQRFLLKQTCRSLSIEPEESLVDCSFTSDLYSICSRNYPIAIYDKWKEVFNKIDTEGFGEILWNDLIENLKNIEFVKVIGVNKRDMLLNRAINAKSKVFTFQDFINIMSGKRSHSFECAVHHRDREISSLNDFHLIRNSSSIVQKMVHLIALKFLTDDRDRKYYADNYSCRPPPLFIISITVLELMFFIYNTLTTGELNASGPVPIDSILVYRPDKKYEVWRFLLYMMIHAGWIHLCFNLFVQLLVGLPLEMVHGSTRVGIVYMSGVIAGSLGTSIFDSNVCLVGASGGVYALLAAHLANVLLNYNNMRYSILRLLGIIAIASCDVGYAIYSRYATESSINDSPVSYVAHLTGAISGLTLGLIVLKNFEQRLHEQLLWWVALGVYTACIIFAVLFNVLDYNSDLFKVVSSYDDFNGIHSRYIYSRFGI